MGQLPGIIQRAFQLAENSANVDEIRMRLRKEGYSNVDGHLMGRKIRSDLTKIIRRCRLEGSSVAKLKVAS